MCTLQTRKLCYNAIYISGESWGGATGARAPFPFFDQNEARSLPSPPPPPLPALSKGLDPPLNINYVLVLV